MDTEIDIQMDTENCRNDTDVIGESIGLGLHGEEGDSVWKDADADEDADDESIDLDQADEEGESEYVDFKSDQCKPYTGMEFKSEEEAYHFYNMYAKRMGFGVRKGKIYRSGPKNCITARKFLCAKEGFKGKDKRRMEHISKPRREIREGCKAMMGISLTEANVWSVKYFVEEHTHGLVTPSKTAKIRSHKRMSAATKSLIHSFHQSMGPSQIASTLTTLNENVVVTPQDTRSYLKTIRKNNIGHECINVVRGFMDKRVKDDGFFYEVEMNEEYRMRSVFWVDSRSRMSYQQFGDVVVFDTTYRTNNFSMPFAPFTGVNHHRQSILFGCALLADETEKTFVWLFETWLKAMWGKRPISIITDQCSEMAKAIQKVFPNTIHRFCMWHIGQNEIKHLSQLKLHQKGFEWDYNRCKYSESIEEFEASWGHLIKTYELEGNSWLQYMYEVRKHWIPCYLKNVFFAGMTTTQRSESMNSFFDGYVSAKTPLNEFIRQYDLALMHRRDHENHEDHVTLYTKPALWSKNPMEIQAGRIYTRKMFELFQKELKNKEAYVAMKISQEAHVHVYEVCMYESNHTQYTVRIDETNNEAFCTCKKFECEGLLCAHVLKVYQHTNVMQIPPKYILLRWTIEARYGCVRAMSEEIDDSNCVTPSQIWCIREAALKCIDMGIQSPQHFKVAMPVLSGLVDKLDAISLYPEVTRSVQEDNLNQIEGCASISEQIHIRILDPEPCITKGRPKNASRIRSSLEVSQEKAKKRMCGNCKKKGHYTTTCPEKKQ